MPTLESILNQGYESAIVHLIYMAQPTQFSLAQASLCTHLCMSDADTRDAILLPEMLNRGTPI